MLSFICVYKVWIDYFRTLLDPLLSVSKPKTPQDHNELAKHVDRMLEHYQDYYKIKGFTIQLHPFFILGGSWVTVLERSLYWVGGWRPITLIHLVYTESTTNFESELIKILGGDGIRSSAGDLVDLSPNQVKKLTELQIETVKKEDEINTELGTWQEKCCDEVLSFNFQYDERYKKDELGVIIQKAEELRFKTIRSVFGVLSPQQGAQLWIVVAQLMFGVQFLGSNNDQKRAATTSNV